MSSRSGGTRRRSTGGRSGGGGASRLLAGFLLGAAAVAGGGYLYLHRDLFGGNGGTPAKPAATLTAPAARSTPKPSAAPASPKLTPPFGISEDVFEAGARIYHGQCASCHGTPGGEASSGAIPLWTRAPGHKAVGVSDHDPADTYAQIAHGNPAKGMPAFAGRLSSTQIWQVSLLLQNAGEDLPDPVLHLLRTGRP